MQYQVLGTVDATDGNGGTNLGGPAQRRLLGVLVANANRWVSNDRLTEALFDGEDPDGALRNLRTYVHRLRAVVGESSVRTEAGGYRLVAPEEWIDVARFERLIGDPRHARELGDPGKAVAILDEAFALWRGTPYSPFSDEMWAHASFGLIGPVTRSGAALDLSVSPDGTKLAAAYTFGIVEWDLSPERFSSAACDVAGRNLTRTEWSSFFRTSHTTRPARSGRKGGDVIQEHPLVVVREPGRTPLHLSLREPLEIGRECDGLLIGDLQASRRLLELRPENSHVVVIDLDSTNGTLVDGEKAAGAFVLRPGMVVSVGDTTIELAADLRGTQRPSFG